jgi:outer membrane lipoprotein SlyB
MHTALKAATVAAALSLAPLVWNGAAEAGKVEGVGIGSGVGAIIAGPVGAVVGGVVGYKVGGPNLLPRQRYCWRDDNGRRRCRRR